MDSTWSVVRRAFVPAFEDFDDVESGRPEHAFGLHPIAVVLKEPPVHGNKRVVADFVVNEQNTSRLQHPMELPVHHWSLFHGDMHHYGTGENEMELFVAEVPGKLVVVSDPGRRHANSICGDLYMSAYK